MSDIRTLISTPTWRVSFVRSPAPWSVNTWLAASDECGILVDPGADMASIQELVAKTEATPVAIALTHGHHDHLVHLAEACEYFNLDAFVAAADQRLTRQAAMFAIRFAGKIIRTPKRLRDYPDDGIVRVGSHALQVRPAPGHTPGGVVLESETFCLTGDTIFREKVGRSDLPGGDLDVLKRTVGELLSKWSDDMVLCPGHGAEWTARDARAWWTAAQANPAPYTEFEA